MSKKILQMILSNICETDFQLLGNNLSLFQNTINIITTEKGIPTSPKELKNRTRFLF